MTEREKHLKKLDRAERILKKIIKQFDKNKDNELSGSELEALSKDELQKAFDLMAAVDELRATVPVMDLGETKIGITYSDSLKRHMKARLIELSGIEKSAVGDVVANIGSQKDKKEISSSKGSTFYKLIVEGFFGYAGAIVKHPAGKVALAISKVLIKTIESTFKSKAKSSPPRNLKAFEADWRNVYTDMEREDSIVNSLHSIWDENAPEDLVEAEEHYKKIIDGLSIDKAAIRKIITEAWIKASKDGADAGLNTEFNSKGGFIEITTHVTFFKDFETGSLLGISWTDTMIQLNDVDKIEGTKKSLENLGIAPNAGGDKDLHLSSLDLETCVKVVIGAIEPCNSGHDQSLNLQYDVMGADLKISEKAFFFIRRKSGQWEISPKTNKPLEVLLEAFNTNVYKYMKVKNIASF